ncbi:hypothetical protein QNI16_37160, partial [Cytophagaceae bacterium YF14B1]
MSKQLLYKLAITSILWMVAIAYTNAQSLYWVGDGGSWNDASHWSTTSGGSGGAGVPATANAAIFDANSFSSAGQTVTLTTGAICNSINWTGVTNNPTLDLAANLTISGTSAIFADAMDLSGTATLIFTSASNTTLTLSNTAKTFGNISFSSNTARTVNVNFASSNAITQTVGVFTVGNNVTLNLNGPANKVFGGISCGTNLRLYQLNNATVNGTANLGASTSLTISGAGYGVDNVVFNGPMSLTQTLIY